MYTYIFIDSQLKELKLLLYINYKGGSRCVPFILKILIFFIFET